jgi:TonB family protein
MMNESLWFTTFVGVALKSTAILGLAWLVTILLRRRSAALRHLVWTAAAAAVLAMPFLSLSLPSMWIPPVGTLAPGVAALFEITTTTTADAPASHSAEPTSSAPRQQAKKRPDWRLIVLALWAACAAAACLQMLMASAGLWRLRRRAIPSPDHSLAGSLAHQLGIPHPVDVLETDEGTMPMTFGVLRPAIFMPRDAEAWTEERRRIVLLHELAHVRRGDVATHLLARFALILNWWNPLAWYAWREFIKERERATDDLVLTAGARASDYAGHLLDVARTRQSSPALAWAAVAMARRSQLEGRLIAILDSRVNRQATGRRAALAAVVLAVAIAAPFAALRAQDKPSASVPADIDATIRAAAAQKNHEMLEAPARAFENLRQYDSAKKLLDAAVAIRADVSGTQSVDYGVGLMKLGDLEKKRNQPKEAEAFYAKAVQVLGNRPEAAPALMYLGISMIGKKNYSQAIDYFQQARNLDANQDGTAQMWMAIVREREQNPTAAETLFRSALAVQPGNSAGAATTMESYASFLKDQGRDDDAKAMSENAAAVRKSIGAEQPREKSTAYHIGAGVTPPKVLSKIEPEYTEEARVAKYQGSVALSLEIGPDGFPRNIQVVRGLGLGLDENAVTAVSQWTFEPGKKDGAPVPVIATIEVNFRLL